MISATLRYFLGSGATCGGGVTQRTLPAPVLIDRGRFTLCYFARGSEDPVSDLANQVQEEQEKMETVCIQGRGGGGLRASGLNRYEEEAILLPAPYPVPKGEPRQPGSKVSVCDALLVTTQVSFTMHCKFTEHFATTTVQK